MYLVGSGREPGNDEHIASTNLFEAILRITGLTVPYRFEQMLWALWNAVYGVDLRPFGRDGQRIPLDASDAARLAAAEHCAEQGIRAWFSVRWERRFDA